MVFYSSLKKVVLRPRLMMQKRFWKKKVNCQKEEVLKGSIGAAHELNGENQEIGR